MENDGELSEDGGTVGEVDVKLWTYGELSDIEK